MGSKDKWNRQALALEESDLKRHLTPLPVVHVTAVVHKEAKKLQDASGVYLGPLYQSPNR